MPTKAELQQQIDQLQQVIARQKAEADLRSPEYVLMTVPEKGREFSLKLCHAPYTADIKTRKRCSWKEGVMPVLLSMLRAHSVPMDSCHGVYPTRSIKFLDDGDCGGEHLVVPGGVADLVVDLINAMGDYGADCYRKGIETASGMLKQLAAGEVSEGEYEDRLTRERIMECQSWRRHRIKDSGHDA